jgi:hypothetical protein
MIHDAGGHGPKVVSFGGRMDGLLESLKNLICVEAIEVSVAAVAMRPAAGAARTRCSDAKPENAVGPRGSEG